jgi:hypothetical protein
MKWLPVVVILILAALGLRWQLNSVKVSYVNGLDQYSVMPGKEYILQVDCYVFNWSDDPAPGFPVIGTNLPAATTRVDALPADATASRAGQHLGKVHIFDLIPRGTRLLITSVRREESRKAGTIITYEAKLQDGIERPYAKVDLRTLLLPVAKGGDVPAIDPTVAVPWIKR